MTYNQIPIRLAASLVSNPPVTPIDANTGQPIRFWRAQALAIQFAAFDVNGACVDLSNINQAQLIIQDSQGSLSPILVKTVNAGSIIPTISKADWDSGNTAQVTFNLTAAEADFSLAGMASRDFWLIVALQVSGGGTLVYVAGVITIFDPGLPAVPMQTNYVSRHAQANSVGSAVVTPLSQIHTEVITVTGVAGNRDIVVQAPGLIAGAHVALRFELPNVDGINLRIFDQSTAGTLLTTITSQADGYLPAARVELEFDGANWNRDFLILPAFGQQN